VALLVTASSEKRVEPFYWVAWIIAPIVALWRLVEHLLLLLTVAFQWVVARVIIFVPPTLKHRSIKLRYFDEILPVEIEAINRRRRAFREAISKGGRFLGRDDVAPVEAKKAFDKSREAGQSIEEQGKYSPFDKRSDAPPSDRDPNNPDYPRTRPQPTPSDLTGLALSGGGIRSAAVCLGALQGLHEHRIFPSIDYLSTVSGGGYTGCCLSAALSKGRGPFPFGEDMRDTQALMHLRNFSNYLLPRGRSVIRNAAEIAVVFLRGFIANFVRVFTAIVSLALLTQYVFPDRRFLSKKNFVLHLLDKTLTLLGISEGFVSQWLHFSASVLLGRFGYGEEAASNLLAFPFSFTIILLALLSLVLTIWVLIRSVLAIARQEAVNCRCIGDGVFLVTTVAFAFLDLQPVAVDFLNRLYDQSVPSQREQTISMARGIAAFLVIFSFTTAIFASWLGQFLNKARNSGSWKELALQGATRLLIFVTASVLPITLWVGFLYLSSWGIHDQKVPVPFELSPEKVRQVSIEVFVVFMAVTLLLDANSYSLHRLYRDRLSKAFLFDPHGRYAGDPPSLDSLKISEILRDTDGPYHIINAAMNVQGSEEANRRGRDADFFIFSPAFIGSDLTSYAPTRETVVADATDMEDQDRALNLAAAMAISGAAVSANMGANTVRYLSPTLALLNIRLGYWLRNPRDLAKNAVSFPRSFARFLGRLIRRHFYLIMEMMNLLDEKRAYVYLTDGGHIENLGAYELLKRGCQLIIVIDSEADSTMSFSSLLKLERYARIDLGVRIALPWERIALTTRRVEESLQSSASPLMPGKGPHCAVGRIIYGTGAEGIIVYFKSSLSGDEKDYLLDYKRRHPDFPHETTGDQFFTEEQFEVYRALGFHIVDGFSKMTTSAGWRRNREGAGRRRRDFRALAVGPRLGATTGLGRAGSTPRDGDRACVAAPQRRRQASASRRSGLGGRSCTRLCGGRERGFRLGGRAVASFRKTSRRAAQIAGQGRREGHRIVALGRRRIAGAGREGRAAIRSRRPPLVR
jgi:hypothetical protein